MSNCFVIVFSLYTMASTSTFFTPDPGASNKSAHDTVTAQFTDAQARNSALLRLSQGRIQHDHPDAAILNIRSPKTTAAKHKAAKVAKPLEKFTSASSPSSSSSSYSSTAADILTRATDPYGQEAVIYKRRPSDLVDTIVPMMAPPRVRPPTAYPRASYLWPCYDDFKLPDGTYDKSRMKFHEFTGESYGIAPYRYVIPYPLKDQPMAQGTSLDPIL